MCKQKTENFARKMQHQTALQSELLRGENGILKKRVLLTLALSPGARDDNFKRQKCAQRTTSVQKNRFATGGQADRTVEF